MNLDKSISNLSQRLDRISPETSSDVNLNDGIRYWQGKKIIPLDQWFRIKKDYGLKAALQFFPNEYPTFGLPCAAKNIEDSILKEEADIWYSEYKDLMEFRKNTTYGHEQCFRCLLNPAREQSKLFIGIDKIIAKAIGRCYNISSSASSPSIYPCRVLNIFECPYATGNTKKEKNVETEDGKVPAIDTSDLFDISEIAFRLEIALGKAQIMTRSNDTIYEVDFENDKVKKRGYFSDAYELCADDPLEEKLAKVERLSNVTIRNRDDIYNALTNGEILGKLLEQGLDEEHQKCKEDIVEFIMGIRDFIQKDLFSGDDPHASYNSGQRQQGLDAKCSICQKFANIHCINCNNIWICADHWKLHRANRHNSKAGQN